MTENNNIFIRNLAISGFKSIKHTDIELHPINIIIGANGAGKSNLLSVFDLLRYHAEKKLRNYDNANDVFHFGTEHTDQMFVELISDDFKYKVEFITSPENDDIRMKRSTASRPADTEQGYVESILKKIKPYHFHNTSPKSKVRSNQGVWDNIQLHPYGGNIASILYKIRSYGEDSNKYIKDQEIFLERYYDLRRRRKVLLKGIDKLELQFSEVRSSVISIENPDLFSTNEGANSQSSINELENLKEKLENIREKRWELRRNIRKIDFEIEDIAPNFDYEYEELKLDDNTQLYIRAYNDILLSIRAVAPYFDDFVLEKNAKDKISLRWKNASNIDKVFGAHQLSDGTLRFILLATLLLQPNPPKVIVLDEPELGLHPTALVVLADIIRSVSKKTQIILTTQSVEFANLFKPEDFIVVDYIDGASSFSRPDKEELEHWLEDYDMGDIWCKNIIGGRP